MHDCHTSTSNVNPSSIPCDFAIVYTLCLITCLGNLTPFWKFKLSNIRQPNIERCNYDVSANSGTLRLNSAVPTRTIPETKRVGLPRVISSIEHREEC